MKNRKMVEEANEKVKRHNNGVVNYNENLHKEVIAKMVFIFHIKKN